MKKTASILLLLTLISCHDLKDVKHDSTSDANNIVVDQIDVVKNKNIILKDLFINIDFEFIKKYFNGSTSAVLPISQTTNYAMVDTNGTYGLYFLIRPDLNDTLPFQGKAIVQFKGSNWRYDDPNESLIELITYSKSLNIIPGINIGDTKKSIIYKIGEPNFKKNNLWYYNDDTDLILTMKFAKDIVIGIKIGKYKTLDANIKTDNF